MTETLTDIERQIILSLVIEAAATTDTPEHAALLVALLRKIEGVDKRLVVESVS